MCQPASRSNQSVSIDHRCPEPLCCLAGPLPSVLGSLDVQGPGTSGQEGDQVNPDANLFCEFFLGWQFLLDLA